MKRFATKIKLLPVILLAVSFAIILQSKTLLADNFPTSKSKVTCDFNDQKTGSISDGWTNVFGKWEVKKDGENKVLAQLAKSKGRDFNIAVLDANSLKNVEMSVDIRAISGKEDQGGGLVWRYIDKNNYYIARFNPLEDNFRLYKVVNGKRIEMKSANVSVAEGVWFNVKVVMNGSKISCFLDGKEFLAKSDDTFSKAGKTGLWTKADAVSDFDNFSLKGE